MHNICADILCKRNTRKGMKISSFYKITLFLFILLWSNAAFSQKDPTSVEAAEKAIAKRRKAEIKAGKKAKKEAEKRHWDRQSKAAKKSIKKNKKRNKKMQRAVRKKQRIQKRYSK